VVTLASGKHIDIRKDRKQEGTFIKSIEVSTTKQILVISLHNRPIELWDLKTFNLLRLISVTDTNALNFKKLNQLKMENLFFITGDGTLHVYSTEKNDSIHEKSKVKPFSQNSQQITCADWKNDIFCAGDANGNLICIEFHQKKSRTISTAGGPIEVVRFSREQNFVLVLYQSGFVSVYELDQMVCLNSFNSIRQKFHILQVTSKLP
jgi:WD40 repeat protein